jgi:hypothetical protein
MFIHIITAMIVPQSHSIDISSNKNKFCTWTGQLLRKDNKSKMQENCIEF